MCVYLCLSVFNCVYLCVSVFICLYLYHDCEQSIHIPISLCVLSLTDSKNRKTFSFRHLWRRSTFSGGKDKDTRYPVLYRKFPKFQEPSFRFIVSFTERSIPPRGPYDPFTTLRRARGLTSPQLRFFAVSLCFATDPKQNAHCRRRAKSANLFSVSLNWAWNDAPVWCRFSLFITILNPPKYAENCFPFFFDCGFPLALWTTDDFFPLEYFHGNNFLSSQCLSISVMQNVALAVFFTLHACYSSKAQT